MTTDFTSPLAITTASRFTALGFGVPPLPPALLELRTTMQLRLQDSFKHLPEPMRHEANAMVEAYSGHPLEFFRLFYQPVWSFVHWVLADTPAPIAQAVRDDACTAQALGLFLHLWDDHLCDGQLKTTELSLQVRTDAWAAYLAAARRLAQQVGAQQSMVDEHTTTYLGAIYIPETLHGLDDFCARFERQIAIWTLVPRLFGRAVGGQQTGEDLAQILRAFSNAWRLMDDLQDVEDDVLAGVESAVWQVLDANGRAAWSACHIRSKSLGQLDPDTWAALDAHLEATGCVGNLLAHTGDWLDRAAALADTNHWPSLAAEIRAHHPMPAAA